MRVLEQEGRKPAGDGDLTELRLDGQAAIVTGGVQGIGLAVAKTLGDRGARVAIVDVRADAIGSAIDGLGDAGIEAIGMAADVTATDETIAAAAAVSKRWGRIDILVNCAGIAGGDAPVVDVDDDTWDRVLAVNLGGTFRMSRAVVPTMERQGYGRIVNIASMAGKDGNPNASHYSASKAGVIALTKSLGKELATTGVLVNAVAPAVIETPILADLTAEQVAYMLSKVPMQRMGQPIEVARLIAFLASRQLTYSTGAVYDISGGRATY